MALLIQPQSHDRMEWFTTACKIEPIDNHDHEIPGSEDAMEKLICFVVVGCNVEQTDSATLQDNTEMHTVSLQ